MPPHTSLSRTVNLAHRRTRPSSARSTNARVAPRAAASAAATTGRGLRGMAGRREEDRRGCGVALAPALPPFHAVLRGSGKGGSAPHRPATPPRTRARPAPRRPTEGWRRGAPGRPRRGREPAGRRPLRRQAPTGRQASGRWPGSAVGWAGGGAAQRTGGSAEQPPVLGVAQLDGSIQVGVSALVVPGPSVPDAEEDEATEGLEEPDVEREEQDAQRRPRHVLAVGGDHEGPDGGGAESAAARARRLGSRTNV